MVAALFSLTMLPPVAVNVPLSIRGFNTQLSCNTTFKAVPTPVVASSVTGFTNEEMSGNTMPLSEYSASLTASFKSNAWTSVVDESIEIF